MKMTTLEIVQQVLNKLGGDEVNSIGDTVESYQIALELQATFYSMLDDIAWPFQYNLVALEASVDSARPTHMKVPVGVDNFKWIRYKDSESTVPIYNTIKYLKPEEFLDMIATNTSAALTVQDYSGAYFSVGTEQDPCYYTSFDDDYVVFDSYNAAVDDTLQSSKVIAFGQTIPTYNLDDTSYPPIPAKYFPQLLAETTAACYFYQRQTGSPIDERRARRSFVRHQNAMHRSLEADKQIPDFGR